MIEPGSIGALPVIGETPRVAAIHQRPHAASETRAEGGGRVGAQRSGHAGEFHCLGDLIPQSALCAKLRSIHRASEGGEIGYLHSVERGGNQHKALVDELIEARFEVVSTEG